MMTVTLPVRASTQANTDRVQRLAYDGLEAMRIAECHLKALSDHCDEWEFDSETEWCHYCIAGDVPYWLAVVRLLISNLEQQCYGPPTLPDRTFREMASIENLEERNLPGSEAITICACIARFQLEESRIVCKDAEFIALLRSCVIVLDMIRSCIDGCLFVTNLEARIKAIAGPKVSRFA